ncbi:MAG: OmpA family protein [archaeon]|nr:OmpA family protein [archaeon]
MKNLFSRKNCLIFLLLLIFSIPNTSIADTKNKLPSRDVLFKTADAKLKIAKEKMADILVPKTFTIGINDYQKAELLYKKNRKLDDIKKYLSRASSTLQKSIEETKVASVFFSKVIKAREDAQKVNGPKFDPENWDRAEKRFITAAGILESGDSKYSKAKGVEAENYYRDAELFAIQSKYLKKTWSLLKRAEKIRVRDYANITLEKAISLSKLSASLLKKHRYDQKEAAKLAQQSEYEAEHAIYLSKKIKKMKDNGQTMEAAILEFEIPLKKIATALNITAGFNNGLDIPILNITDVIKELKKENNRLAKILTNEKKELYQITTNKDMEIVSLKEQVAMLEQRLSKLTSSQQILKGKVKQQKIKQQKIARISSLFSANEGKTLIDGKNVIIRLYGISFPTGKSIIEPQYFSLLSKVKNAFAEFPNCRIKIEGHTDSVGSDDINQHLSEERAKSVKQYFLANSNILLSRIKAIGYGETRPVASNETSHGQAKNRRIDVVIIPFNDI